MEVKLAKTAGFCFGVSRAVNMCREAADTYKGGCVMLGPVIHNEHVISELEGKGVRVVTDLGEIPQGSAVIIPAHGAGRDVYEELALRGAEIIDATCPDVKKIHDIVAEESSLGRLIVIIGQRMHPEIKAISGWSGEFIVFEDAEELSRWMDTGENRCKPMSIVFQTTNSQDIFCRCIEVIKKVYTNQKLFDTICGATFKRQQEAAELSRITDVMVVVGGRNSANSLRLADICKQHCSRVIFAENLTDLEDADIRSSDIVGITAGASTPAWIIKEVTQKMSEEVKLDETQVAPELTVESQSSVPEPEPAEDTVEITPASVGDAVVSLGNMESEEPQAAKMDVDSVGVSGPVDSGSSDVEEKKSGMPVAIPDKQSSTQEDNVPAEQPAASETFEEMLEKSIKTLRTGEKVTGIVTTITATEVSVDLGTKQSGYIPISEFTDDTNSKIEDIIKIGDSIESFVMRVNDVEGMVMLSKRRLDAVKNWDVIEAAKESRAIMDGVVTDENKGGVVVNVKGVRVFVPASQTGLPKSSPMSDLVKKPVKLRITEVNQSRRRVVGSIRAVQADERREKSDRVWNDIEKGRQYTGVVKSMTSYGVFVDIGGVDGMIHISELSWTRIKQPSEIMSVGDEVSVYVLSFDKDNRKISLGYKKNEDNPWTRFTTRHSVGDTVSVKIVKMMPFGAFAEIIPGVDGLIHISQIADHRIGLPSEILSNGQVVEVKITEIDNDRKKVSLSIRAIADPSSQSLGDREDADMTADNTPVVVYDTDAPPLTELDEEPELEPA